MTTHPNRSKRTKTVRLTDVDLRRIGDALEILTNNFYIGGYTVLAEETAALRDMIRNRLRKSS